MKSVILLFILLVQLYHFQFQQYIASKLSYFQESHLTSLVMLQICHSIQHRKFYIQIEYYYTYLKAVYFDINVHESHNINISWQPATQVYLYWMYILKNIHVNKTQKSVYVFTFFAQQTAESSLISVVHFTELQLVYTVSSTILSIDVPVC